MVPTRRSVKISSRKSAFGSTLMSLVVSGLVAMSVGVRLHELPAAGAIWHVRIVGGERRAVVPVGNGCGHDGRVVIARPVAGPVIVRTRPDEKSAADEHTRAAVKVMRSGPCWRSRGSGAASEATAVSRAGIERARERHDRAGCDGEPLHGPRIAPAALRVSSRAMTWSIIARDATSGAFGVAIATP